MAKSENTRDFFDTLFKQASEPFTNMLVLSAIWPEKGIKTSKGKKYRITKGDLVSIENGQLIDCEDKPSHEIMQCHGTITSSCLSITVRNIITNELSVINL